MSDHSPRRIWKPEDKLRIVLEVMSGEAELAERRRKLTTARDLQKQENLKLRQRRLPFPAGENVAYSERRVVLLSVKHFRMAKPATGTLPVATTMTVNTNDSGTINLAMIRSFVATMTFVAIKWMYASAPDAGSGFVGGHNARIDLECGWAAYARAASPS